MKPRTPLLLLCLLACLLKLSAQEEGVVFSASGGFYQESFSLSLDCFYPEHHIRYTTNGGTPTASSALYTGPLTLDSSMYSNSNIYTIVNCLSSAFYLPDNVERAIVVRAAVFDENDSCISEVSTNSYFIASLDCNTHGLPAISLCAICAYFHTRWILFIPKLIW